MARYSWTVSGWNHRPHSSTEWVIEEASGVIEVDDAAADAGDALVAVIAGRLPDGTPVGLEESIPWGPISLDREVTITFRPDHKPEESGT